MIFIRRLVIRIVLIFNFKGFRILENIGFTNELQSLAYYNYIILINIFLNNKSSMIETFIFFIFWSLVEFIFKTVNRFEILRFCMSTNCNARVLFHFPTLQNFDGITSIKVNVHIIYIRIQSAFEGTNIIYAKGNNFIENACTRVGDTGLIE